MPGAGRGVGGGQQVRPVGLGKQVSDAAGLGTGHVVDDGDRQVQQYVEHVVARGQPRLRVSHSRDGHDQDHAVLDGVPYDGRRIRPAGCERQ